MSILPLDCNSDELLNPFDSILDDYPSQMYQEIMLQPANDHDNVTQETRISEAGFDGKQLTLTRKRKGPSGKATRRKRISNPNSKKTMKAKSKKSIDCKEVATPEQEEGTSAAKKIDHNAKERIRRMKINASFLALRGLLPDSRRSKKRWSAPSLVDRALKYIPELQNEIQELKSKKQIYAQAESSPRSKHVLANDQNPTSNFDEDHSISISKVNQNEAIVQICVPRDDDRKGYSAFTNMLEKVENEGYLISSASTLRVCESRICHHLHIQIDENFPEDEDYLEELREKLLSWLVG